MASAISCAVDISAEVRSLISAWHWVLIWIPFSPPPPPPPPCMTITRTFQELEDVDMIGTEVTAVEVATVELVDVAAILGER